MLPILWPLMPKVDEDFKVSLAKILTNSPQTEMGAWRRRWLTWESCKRQLIKEKRGPSVLELSWIWTKNPYPISLTPGRPCDFFPLYFYSGKWTEDRIHLWIFQILPWASFHKLLRKRVVRREKRFLLPSHEFFEHFFAISHARISLLG